MYDQPYLSDELELQARLATGDHDLDILERIEVIEDFIGNFKGGTHVLELLFHIGVIARDDDGLPDISGIPQIHVENVAPSLRYHHWDEFTV